MTEPLPLRVGDVLHGHCRGAFDEFYGEKRVEMIGADWVVVRTDGSQPLLFAGKPEDLAPYRSDAEHERWCLGWT